MIALSLTTLFSLVAIIFFPLSFTILIISLLCLTILLAILAVFLAKYRLTVCLILAGLLLASLLAIPKLLHYQSAFQALPHQDTYQFQVTAYYPESHALEARIIEPSAFKNLAFRLYNVPKAQPIALSAIYEAQLTLKPNRAKASFHTLPQRLQHLSKNRIATANLSNHAQLTEIQQSDAITTLRAHIADELTAHHYQNGDLMAALTVGMTQKIPQDTWSLLRQTGTIHLVSISGLHLTFVALWCFVMLRTLFGLCMIARPAPYQIAAVFSLIIAFGYALLAGMSLPTERALIMFAIFMLTLLWRYPIFNLSSLATALLIVLILAPFSVLTVGLWLSFTAVLILMLLSRFKLPFIVMLLLTQLIISLLAMPIVASFFNEVSLISPLTNLFAIPWTTLFILPPLLMGVVLLPIFPSIANFFLHLSDWGLTHLLQFLKVMNDIPYSHITVPHIPMIWAIILTVCALMLLTRHDWKIKGIAGLIAVSCLCGINFPNPHNRLYTFPVGEGLSVLLESDEQTLLYDTGPYFRGFEAAKSTILPTLNALGIEHLDGIILSLRNQQHIGGTKTIRRQFPDAPIIAHQSLMPLMADATACQDYHYHGNHLSIMPLPVHTSCAFEVMLDDQRIWLLSNMTPREWQALTKLPAPDILLMPNKGRSGQLIIPNTWDATLIASTKTVHKNHSHSNIHNAYDGAIMINIKKGRHHVKTAASHHYWWMTKSQP